MMIAMKMMMTMTMMTLTLTSGAGELHNNHDDDDDNDTDNAHTGQRYQRVAPQSRSSNRPPTRSSQSELLTPTTQ